MSALARHLGCTEGQAWTLVLAAVLAVVTVGLGLPPAFRGGEVAADVASPPALVAPRVGPEDSVQVPTLVTLLDPPPALRAPARSRPLAAPLPAGPTTTSTSATVVVAAPTPLAVRESGWASARGGTPVAASEVPEGSLPVGARLGQTDEVSFVRLTGTDAVLRLSMLDDPLADGAAVLACPITDPTWEPATNVSLADAPAHDCQRGVAGVRGADGTWAFDLASHPDRAGPEGFALVPAADATTFRIRYATTAR